jgi:RNA polymerase sigma factor (sigma-70 family)
MLFSTQKHISKISDQELISGYKTSGEVRYAGELFQRYNHLVFGVCMKYLKNQEESRDAVMNIFEKLLEDLKKHEIGNFKGWLHTVTRNHCLMFIRTGKKMSYSGEESIEGLMELSYSLHLYNDDNDGGDYSRLEDCMDKLVEAQKKCVELFYLQEKCYKEVGELTNYSLNEVKSYIQNGKRNLKNCIEGKK